MDEKPDEERLWVVNVYDPFRWRLRIPHECFITNRFKEIMKFPRDANYAMILAELVEFGPPYERMTWIVKDLDWFEALRGDLDGDLLYDFVIDAGTLKEKCIDVYWGWFGDRDFGVDRSVVDPPR